LVQPGADWTSPAGFPHSDISGSKPARGSPKLFAACHVLHRLLAPRHPPRALCSLTSSASDQAVTGCKGRIGILLTTRRNRRFRLLPITIQLVRCDRREASLRMPHTAAPQRSAGRWPRWLEGTDQGIERVVMAHCSGGTGGEVVETRRLELLTLSLQRRCSSD
jgi:hypothetical protein